MDVVLQLGAVAVAIVAIIALLACVYRAWRKVDAFLEDWNGEPARAGRDGRPSMPERMAGVEKRLTQVESAVHNI